MKFDLNLLSQNKHHVLTFYETQLSAEDIDELETQNVFIFPIEQVYSTKQLLTIIHLVLDNAEPNTSMLDLKLAISALFYGNKKPFRSYYNIYIVAFIDQNKKNHNKNWDSELKDLKDRTYCDYAQIRKSYQIPERQKEDSEHLNEYICSALNLLAIKKI